MLLVPADSGAEASSPEPEPSSESTLGPEPDGRDEILIHASRVEERLYEAPAAVSVITADEIQLGRQQLTLGESLEAVPGVFTQNRTNFAQDLRISIRGFGARARFGIRGIKLIVDGIPATLPDGQGQVDSLQLSTAGRIEVVRGPASSLYGSASGGVIRIESERAPGAPYVDGRVAFGSNGYQSYGLKSTGQAGPVGLLVGVLRPVLDGYRFHSRMESNVLNSRMLWEIDEQSDLSATVSFVYSPIADDAGGLTALEVAQNRRQARDRNVEFDSGERVSQVSSGLRYRRDWNADHETSVAGYFGWRSFDGRIPFDASCRVAGRPQAAAIDLDRFFGGGSIQHVYADEYFGLPNRLLVGFDVEVQRDDRVRRCNYGDSLGPRTLNQEENVTSLRGFLQDELGLPWDLKLALSVGFDALQYEVRDRFPVSSADPDDSDEFSFTQWSPMFGLTWNPSDPVNLYGRISTSFEPPTTTELSNPVGGGFNRNLDAQRAANFELGAKGDLGFGPKDGRLQYELAVYYIRIRDEIIPFEPAGEVFYRNAGRSSRAGVETALTWEILDGLRTRLVYTFSASQFDEYWSLAGADLSGNQVPGVPEQLLYGELAYRHASGLFGSFEARYIGRFFADDANRVETESYAVLDLRIGWEGRLGDWRLTPYVGINNLLDSAYIDNIRINAGAGRYYEPAPEIEFHGGLGVAYHFEGP